MNFEIKKRQMTPDPAGGVPIEGFVVTEYRAEMIPPGAFHVYQTIDGVEHLIAAQPWNFDAEGNRIEWESIEQAIAWFQTQNGNVEE